MSQGLERGRRPPDTTGCPLVLAMIVLLIASPVVLLAGFVAGLITR